ncbi:MAG: alpha/beta hydrolase [Planctomycetes bacterium]|nr:alpha/beta hydrolase [Planctomycetota bacterium]
MPDVAVIPYKKTSEAVLNLHVMKPESPRGGNPPPVILFFFCGGWHGWNPLKFFPQSEYLASLGMTAISVEVRVEPRHGTTPFDCVVDAKSSVRWVRRHAGELGIDPDRIVTGGGSAGGHVAACCGVIDGPDEPGEDFSISSRSNAMVLFNPVVDLLSLERRIDRFGGSERAARVSPLQHVAPGLPQALVMHGTDDEVVDIEQVYRFQAAMRKAGNRCDLRVYKGEGHGFFNWFDGNNPMFYNTLRDTHEFLASIGFLQGPPSVDDFPFSTPPQSC